MQSIKVNSKVKIYEINSEDVSFDEKEISVNNHWNMKSLVILKVDGKSYTLDAEDLKRAIENAQHAHKF